MQRAGRRQRVPLTRDSMILVNAREPHSRVHHGTAGSSAVLVLYVEPAWLEAPDPQLAVAGLQGLFPESCVAIPPHVRLLADRLVGGMLADARPCGHVMGAQFTDQRADERGGEHREAALGELVMSVVHEFSACREREAIRRANLRRPSDPRAHRSLRLRRLGQDGVAITEVAGGPGFSELRHFTRFFRQNPGITPGKYQRSVELSG